jgi:hypothetical protein
MTGEKILIYLVENVFFLNYPYPKLRFLSQNNGKLSNRARENEFSSLTELEVLLIEARYREVFLL